MKLFTLTLFFAFVLSLAGLNAQVVTLSGPIDLAPLASDPPACVTLGMRYYNTTSNVTRVCTSAGTPGTWANIGGAGTASYLFNMGSCSSNTFHDTNGVALFSLATANCDGDSQPFAVFNAITTQSYAVIHGLPPVNWSVGAVDVKINWFQTGGVSDGNIQWNVQSYCIADAGTVTGSPTYNTASTVTVAQPAASVEGSASVTGINITGCTATSRMYIKVFNSLNGSGGTTSARQPDVEGVTVTFR